ncbi:PHA/PHB synthase family protein [Streptomyces sp. SudanB182_2057]|uniref:PHA/PHB synthase family protein n=1 Tax=Streptomyces sp. SudanB182_2057 TaxID=3035281 RepID=UPI003F5523F8
MSPCGSEPYAYDEERAITGRWAKTARALRSVRREVPGSGGPGPDPGDQRFTDPAWSSDACYRLVLNGYLSWRRLLMAAAEAPGLAAHRRRQAEFLAQNLTEALAPTNTLVGNPAALRRALHTRGASLAKGTGNFLDDAVRRRGRPAKMPPGAYRLGENLAATPGRVVYRNELMEVLQYEPRTAQVHQVPLLLIPAWVNKYYIYDLAPGRSLVEWAVQAGFTVFAISLRNPGPDQNAFTLDEYVEQGPLRAMDVVREITRSPQAHVVGVCAGGILAASLAAWYAAGGQSRVATVTLLMSALDYPRPDTGEKPSAAEMRMLTRLLSNREGLVDGRRISLLFDLLRPRDTIWQPMVAGWLLGERPRPFDIWAWSEDGIDVSRALFDQSLHMAVDNTLARGRLRIKGRPIDLSTVTQDAFVVAAVRDHIVPWETVYNSARLLGGDVGFHLIPSGHVGSLISPPRPAAAYRTSHGALPADPEDWLSASFQQHGSWWTEWTRWLAPRSGPQVASRAPGSPRYPAAESAPGSYVRST